MPIVLSLSKRNTYILYVLKTFLASVIFHSLHSNCEKIPTSCDFSESNAGL